MPRKVTRLTLDLDFDFHLVAVVCSLRNYKMCFELNHNMGLDLKRRPDLEIADRDRNRSLHVHYTTIGPGGEEIDVVANKGTKGHFVPEKKNINYFLVIRNANHRQAKALFKKLRSQPWLEGAYELEPSRLKSAENFLLFE